MIKNGSLSIHKVVKTLITQWESRASQAVTTRNADKLLMGKLIGRLKLKGEAGGKVTIQYNTINI